MTPYADCSALTLNRKDPTSGRDRQVLLTPFDRPRAVPPSGGLRLVTRQRWSRQLLWMMTASGRAGGLLALASADIDVLPYQLEPALAILRGLASRALLADAVGLGKTIQAGLVLAELLARGQLRHALIVTPVGLRDQWAAELKDRFGIDAGVVDAQWIRLSAERWPPSVNPWTIPPVVITSLDFVKRPENLGALSGVIWDLLIVDEAHAATHGTDRGDAASELARHARKVLLLTATPHSGDARAFLDLCRIGALSSSDSIALFRRTRRDGPETHGRRVHLLRVRPTGNERRMHDLLAGYAARAWTSAPPDRQNGGRLAIAVLLKRAASSAFSLARSVAFRRAGLSGLPSSAQAQLLLPLEDEDAADQEPSVGLDLPALPDSTEEHAWLERLEDAATAASVGESKLRALSRLLGRTTEQVIVFTEFRDTLHHVAREVASAASCTLLHGGLDRAARRDAVRQFESGAARVLLATDAGGEGLNLQARCRLVVNVELPWNPMRLEQRIGRVDRIGQKRTVHGVHLVADGTFESALVARLAARIDRARAALGSVENLLGPLDEMAVADALIAGTDLPPLVAGPDVTAGQQQVSIITPQLAEEANAESTIAESWRRFRRGSISPGGSPTRGSRRPAVRVVRQAGPEPRRGLPADVTRATVITRRRLLRGLARAEVRDRSAVEIAKSACVVCVFAARYIDHAGRFIEESLIPVAGYGWLEVPRTRAGQRTVFLRLLGQFGAAFRACAGDAAACRASELQSTVRAAIAGPRQRETALIEALNRLVSGPRLLQAGLFDHRAARAAAALDTTRDALRRSGAERLLALDAASGVSLAGEPDLALMLVVSG